MIISIIAAMSQNRVIGKNGKMPWHIPEEMKIFRETTLYHSVIMGRLTYQSMEKPLSERRNIVISSKKLSLSGVSVVPSLDAALSLCKGEKEIFIIGGETLFKQALPIADKIYLSVLDLKINGDAFFPEWDKNEFSTVSKEKVNAKTPFTHYIYSRNKIRGNT